MSTARRFAKISIGVAPTGRQVLMRRAVVLGGSVAGLMAARVLSDHADEVVIIERDDLGALRVPTSRLAADPASAAGPRPGVPQGSHVHTLLLSGQRQLERWFPGFVDEAIAAGAVSPPPGGGRFYLNGALLPEMPAGGAIQGIISSRPFLEALIRNRVLALPQVRVVHGRVDGLTLAGGTVTGVRWVASGTGAAVEEAADLVVDATGRSSRLGDWLEGYGFPRPPMQRMGIKLNYASALFRRPADPDVWVAISVNNPAAGKSAGIGALTPIEGERWTMLVSGYDDNRPSRDLDDYRRRCAEDFPALFGHIATTAERLSDVVTYHQADSRRRDFHKLDRFPARLIAAGDAVASFNPIHAQGMTSAILHASCLSAYLRGNPDLAKPALPYFADVKVVVDAAWQVSTLSDLSLPHVDGPYPRGYRFMQRISHVLVKASMRDRKITHLVGRVTTMLEHPSVLSRPGILVRVLAAAARP